MYWLKGDMRKIGIAIAGSLLLLILMVWVPVLAVSAQERASGLATPVAGTVQVTPTIDATVTALNKEKLAQEVEQLKKQNAPDLFGWLRTNAAILLSTLVVVIGGLIGLFRWFGDRRDAQDKNLKAQAEERFKTAVTALGDEKEGTQVGGAILLRSFLNKDEKGYERYYAQIFDLAVAYLRPSSDSKPLQYELWNSTQDSTTPLSPTTLRQALIVVFKEAFPLVRDRLKEQDPKTEFHPQSLDATGIQLDKAYLSEAHLENAWLPSATLLKANLRGAFLENANLSKAILTKANLAQAKLQGAVLENAVLTEAALWLADLREAYLQKAELQRANLLGANLKGADLRKAKLQGADLRGVDLGEAILDKADLTGAKLSELHITGIKLSELRIQELEITGTKLSELHITEADLPWLSRAGLSSTREIIGRVNIDAARSLEGTKMHGVTGLTQEQLEACKAKGAFIDEAPTTSPPQSTVSPSPPEPRHDALAPSAPPAQESTPTPDTGGGSAISSKPSPGA